MFYVDSGDLLLPWFRKLIRIICVVYIEIV